MTKQMYFSLCMAARRHGSCRATYRSVSAQGLAGEIITLKQTHEPQRKALVALWFDLLDNYSFQHAHAQLSATQKVIPISTTKTISHHLLGHSVGVPVSPLIFGCAGPKSTKSPDFGSPPPPPPPFWPSPILNSLSVGGPLVWPLAFSPD